MPFGFVEGHKRDYLAGFGAMMVAWNLAESGLRHLLVTAIDSSLQTYMIVAELGTRGLTDGLNSVASTYPPRSAKPLRSSPTFSTVSASIETTTLTALSGLPSARLTESTMALRTWPLRKASCAMPKTL